MSDEQKHTPEPWRTMPDDEGVLCLITPDPLGHRDPGAFVIVTGADEYQAATNAARIVTCVNACAEIEDPADYISRAETTRMALIRERDQLRAECEAAAAYVSVIPISVGLTPQTAEQYNAYIPYLTARTKGD